MINWLNPLFIIGISTGVVFIITAILTRIFPPKKINHVYGYRTKSSMKSQDRWDFAQDYSSKLMLRIGVVMSLLSLMGLYISYTPLMDTLISLVIILLLSFRLFRKTENAIKKKFDNGLETLKTEA